jgi:hypothetical protein
MMLCDISVFFNSFADAFRLMSRKLSSESRQVLLSRVHLSCRRHNGSP